MADWSGLRQCLGATEERVTFAWLELDELVGGLPPSAYDHAAFWKGDRSSWPGFTTTDVRVGETVTFVRRQPVVSAPVASSHSDGLGNNAVLVGCVKTKLDHPAPARDLYASALFCKERLYAEASGAPWFVLSAQHGLVEPGTVIAPYEMSLPATSREYRRTWGARVAAQLRTAIGPLAGQRVEVHAAAAYANAIREPLERLGAVVVEPLAGLRQGERLAWYLSHRPAFRPNSVPSSDGRAPGDIEVVTADQLVARLTAARYAMTPKDLFAMGGEGLRRPGLYSWWVDAEGARLLSQGLGHEVGAGLAYAGQAGATRRLSGRASANTLWGRIAGMHLGGRHQLSTFRLTLGSVLASASGAYEIDEAALTTWMGEHLRVLPVPVDDNGALDQLETAVLAALDPPLNLAKMGPSPVRSQLKELRRQYSRKARGATRAASAGAPEGPVRPGFS